MVCLIIDTQCVGTSCGPDCDGPAAPAASDTVSP